MLAHNSRGRAGMPQPQLQAHAHPPAPFPSPAVPVARGCGWPAGATCPQPCLPSHSSSPSAIHRPLAAAPVPTPLLASPCPLSHAPCSHRPAPLPTPCPPCPTDVWWVSALGTASSLCYVFIALILGLVYSGNHSGSVGGRPGDSAAQKVFGILNSLGNIAFAFGGRGVLGPCRGGACWAAQRLGAAAGRAAPPRAPWQRGRRWLTDHRLPAALPHPSFACRLRPGAAGDPRHAEAAATCTRHHAQGGRRRRGQALQAGRLPAHRTKQRAAAAALPSAASLPATPPCHTPRGRCRPQPLLSPAPLHSTSPARRVL